jgi:hypothetical protein
MDTLEVESVVTPPVVAPFVSCPPAQSRETTMKVVLSSAAHISA